MNTDTQHPTASTQHGDAPKDCEVVVRCTATQKTMVRNLAALHDCSEAALGRSLLESHYHDLFGDLDPLLVREATTTSLGRDGLRDLLTQDLDHDVLHDELQRVTTDDDADDDTDDTDADANESDETDTSRSYSANLIPAQLARSGPECDWEELREAVKDPIDGGFWSDDLQIHPDRVGETTLRSNHKLTPRVLAAMARWHAHNDDATGPGILVEAQLVELVDTYCRHLTDRDPRDLALPGAYDGAEHIYDAYLPRLEHYLWPHPKPESPLYYASEACFRDALPTLLDQIADTFDPDVTDRPTGATAADRLADTLRTAVVARRLANTYHGITTDDLAEAVPAFRDDTAETHRLTKLADDADPTDPAHQLVVLANTVERHVRENVDTRNLLAVGDALHDATLDRLRPETVTALRPETAGRSDSDESSGETPPPSRSDDATVEAIQTGDYDAGSPTTDDAGF